MSYPQVVTGGRIPQAFETYSSLAEVSYSAGNVGDLIVVVVNVARSSADSTIRYYPPENDPANWTILARADEVVTEGYAKLIAARVADSVDAGSVTFQASGGARHAAISYRFKASTWEGTINGGVAVSFLDSDSYDPPSLAPGWGTAPILWLAGVMGRRTSTVFSAGPTGFYTLQDTQDTSTANNHYSRAMSMEREETGSSIDPSPYVTDVGEMEAPRPFTVAVLGAGQAPRPGVTITDIKEPNEADTPVTDVSLGVVKAWYGIEPVDEGAEDALLTEQSISAGSMTVDLPNAVVGDTVILVVRWDAGGGETKFFRTTGTIIDLDA